MGTSFRYLLVSALIVLAVVAAVNSVHPPRPLAADAPADRFSAGRAYEQLAEIARAPRPVGSAENARVRQLLVDKTRALGLEVEVQEATVAMNDPRWGLLAGRVANVLARLPGTRPGRSLVLMAHHDSVPGGPGASDDGSGVVTLLETARALKAGPPLANDVLFLFTDAEEAGLLGARAFFEQHPRAAEVGMVVNFEARGNRGASVMFETSSGDGQLIQAFARAVPSPVAFSFTYEVYKRLPNDTDFTVARRAGKPGLNFAYIDNVSAYHLAQDDLKRVDRASLQDHGDAALGLARELGNADLTGSWQSPNAIYFPFFSLAFVHYPGALAWPLTALAVIGLILLILRGRKRERLSTGRLLGGFTVALVGTVVLFMVAGYLSRFVWSPPYNFLLWNGRSSNSLYLLAIALFAAGLAVALLRWAAGRFGGENLAAGGLVLAGVAAVAAGVLAPGASYLFVWPLLAGIATLWTWVGAPKPEAPGPATIVCLALTGVVTAGLWAPSLALFGTTLEAGAAGLMAGGVFLLLAAFLSALLALGRPAARGRLLPLGLVGIGLALIVAVKLSAGFSPENRRLSSLWYWLDTESGQASWMSLNPAVDPFIRPFLTDQPERAPLPRAFNMNRPAMMKAAPVLEGAAATTSAYRTADGKAHVRFAWAQSPDRLLIALRPTGRLASLSLDGEALRLTDVAAGAPTTLLFHGPGRPELDLELEVEGGSVELEVVHQRFGLPTLPGQPTPQRPADTMPGLLWVNDSVLIRSTLTIDPATLPPAPEPVPTTPG
ncbi:MAG TPA: M20/M25/M40 family metallo-hydrolase [Thermoanaerobaculia bacterium]|nr:M20/M25/M40 family metallo-hydrolase [Thermoanaerobaculia bacterium]